MAFLSIQAQDFIEETVGRVLAHRIRQFLSIQAQDFIEDCPFAQNEQLQTIFLSIQAQDFIEERRFPGHAFASAIPEHSSSGLH